MSPKTAALVKLYVTVAVLALPGLALTWAAQGYNRVAAVLAIAGLSIAVIYQAYQKAIGELKDGDGNTGGNATTLGGKSTPPPPAAPFRGVAPAVVALVVLAGCAWFKANGATVVSDLGSIGACVLAAADSTPTPSLATIASDCGAATVQDVITILDQSLSDEQASPTPNTTRIVALKALGADAARAKHPQVRP